MKKTICLFSMFFLLSITLFSQSKSSEIQFTKLIHDFGQIKEADGEASFRFEFINRGKVPAILVNVKPSCDCTTPEWSKAPVPPGGKGFVTATYDPHLRYGNFNKSILVKFAGNTEVTLHIKGDVIPQARSVEEMFRYKMGDFWLNTSKVPFAKLKKTDTSDELLPVYNSTDNTMKVTFQDVPAHLKLTLEPATLKPKEKGYIRVSYDATKKSGTGFLKDKVSVLVNGKKTERNILHINATLVP